MRLISQIRAGLEIIEEYNWGKDLQITEVGNCLAVWDYNSDKIDIPPESDKFLRELGWSYSETDGWLHQLSG